MKTRQSETRQNEIEVVGKAVKWWLEQKQLSLEEFARRASFPLQFARTIVEGRLPSISVTILKKCVTALGLTNGRGRFSYEQIEHLTYEDCKSMLLERPHEQLQMEFDERSES